MDLKVRLKGRGARRDVKVIKFLLEKAGRETDARTLFYEFGTRYGKVFSTVQGFALYLKRFRFKKTGRRRFIVEEEKIKEAAQRIKEWRK